MPKDNKKPFIAIIGSRNAGKSTIIRCLTGAPTAQFRGTITDRSSQRTIEVIGSSPQENPLALADFRKILGRAITSANCNGVVCAIQPTHPRARLSLETIMQEAIGHGFAVHSYTLDPEHSGRSGNATQVGVRTKAIGISSLVLDARRFGHINAEVINRRTRIAA